VGGNVDSAWAYTRSGGVRTRQGRLVGTGEQGPFVALSAEGSTSIVGAPFDNANVSAAWIFVRPSLQVTPATGVVAAGNPGGPFAPLSFQYQLSATAGSIDYSILGAPNWLTASSTTGTASTGTTVTFTR
jgi:hypothetical protein